MNPLFVLPLIALVTACSHPLEIEGRGDIESSTGANDCALEDQPCSNLVAGTYNVTYTGVPRAGWTFVGWDGCGAQYPDCAFNVPAATVQQYWFQTMPALRARFISEYALNDTGIVFGGNVLSGNNTGCTGHSIAEQDCSNGRDATDNVASDGHAGFSYTKLAIDGAPLPAGAASWSCVKDNTTGRVWEVKTDDGGIHDKDNTYRWGGATAQGTGYGTYYADWNTLVNGSNATAFCGYTDWRVPTLAELKTLVNYNRINPTIVTAYFPNTNSAAVWSASPSGGGSLTAWNLSFASGTTFNSSRSAFIGVRLVRAGP